MRSTRRGFSLLSSLPPRGESPLRPPFLRAPSYTRRKLLNPRNAAPRESAGSDFAGAARFGTWRIFTVRDSDNTVGERADFPPASPPREKHRERGTEALCQSRSAQKRWGTGNGGREAGHDSRKKSEPLAGAYTRREPEASGVTVPLRPIRREDGRQRGRGRPKIDANHSKSNRARRGEMDQTNARPLR